RIELARFVLAEGRYASLRRDELRAPRAVLVDLRRPQVPRAEVGVNVAPRQHRHACATIAVPAGDDVAARGIVSVLDDRAHVADQIAELRRRSEQVIALAHAPAIVGAARRTARLEVDLLPQSLADVANEEIAGQAIEAEPERI